MKCLKNANAPGNYRLEVYPGGRYCVREEYGDAWIPIFISLTCVVIMAAFFVRRYSEVPPPRIDDDGSL